MGIDGAHCAQTQVKIAISGTHGSGKSTLVEDFLDSHKNFIHEPEPYEWLDDAAAEPGVDEFLQQFEISIERIGSHSKDANVIFERSPLDFIAYIEALYDLGRAGRDCALLDSMGERAADALAQLDVLVILPLDGRIDIHESEDLELREAMDERLLQLVASDPYALLTRERPRVLEIRGTRSEALEQIGDVLKVLHGVDGPR